MKRHILVSISLLFLLLAGCSKDDDGSNDNGNSEYYFQFKVDGTDQNYNFGDDQVNLTGSYGYDESTGYALNIGGIKNIFESGKNTLTIYVGDTGGISKGVNYSNIPGEGDDYPDFMFLMGYYNSEGNIYSASGLGDIPVYGLLYRPAFVKFSEIAEAAISGTFSGTLLWYDSSGGTAVLMDSVVISEGKFNVPVY